MAVANCRCGHRFHASGRTDDSGKESNCLFSGDNVSISDVSSLQHDQQVCCTACSINVLFPNITRYKAAIETERIERIAFQQRLLMTRLVDRTSADEEITLSNTRALPDPSYIHHQVHQLRQKLDSLRSVSNELAVRVTSNTMENDERQSKYQVNQSKIDFARERLSSMKQNLLLNAETSDDVAEEKKAPDSSHHNIITNMDGELREALLSGTKQIQTTRFYFALRVFAMHRIDVGEEYSTGSNETSTRNNAMTTASGIGKIGGLPLPHAGPALYGVLPPGMLASSLRLVASLTNLLASCLGVVLPHPILICSKECSRCGNICNYGGDVVDTVGASNDMNDSDVESNLCSSCEKDDFKEASEYHELHSEHPDTKKQPRTSSSSMLQKIPSKYSVLSFVGASARKAVALATGSATTSRSSVTATSTLEPIVSPATKPLHQTPTSAFTISRRIRHASFAVLRENHESGAVEYVLDPPCWKEGRRSTQNESMTHREQIHSDDDKFATGLQLLQNDVVALCFRAGVDAATLWPAESMLLNLHSLMFHCVRVVEANHFL